MKDIVLTFYGYEPTLWFSDKELVNDLYMTKNKYFDKHPLIRNLAEPLLGDSILLQQNNEFWNAKRKTIASSMYKDKIVLYLEMAKDLL